MSVWWNIITAFLKFGSVNFLVILAPFCRSMVSGEANKELIWTVNDPPKSDLFASIYMKVCVFHVRPTRFRKILQYAILRLYSTNEFENYCSRPQTCTMRVIFFFTIPGLNPIKTLRGLRIWFCLDLFLLVHSEVNMVGFFDD